MAKDPALRIAVVDDDRLLSSVWRVWSNGDDVYVAVRSVAGEFKTSLHASGKFRHAFVTDAASARLRGPDKDRATSKWTRQAEQVPGGTLLMQIIIPGAGLGGYLPKYDFPAELVPLEPCGEDGVIYVSIVQTAPGVQTEGPTFPAPTKALSSWQLPSGSTIWVTAHAAKLLPGNREALNQIKQFARSKAEPTVLVDREGEPPSELRGFVILRASDGVGQVMDLSMEFLRDAASPTDDAV
jgi:hypothetical protein